MRACSLNPRLSSPLRTFGSRAYDQTVLISLQLSVLRTGAGVRAHWAAPPLGPAQRDVPDWGISSAGRATGLQPVGQRFDPAILHQSFFAGGKGRLRLRPGAGVAATACLATNTRTPAPVLRSASALAHCVQCADAVTTGADMDMFRFWPEAESSGVGSSGG